MEQVMNIYSSIMGTPEQKFDFVQSDDMCCICLNDMTFKKTFTTKCNHTYHHDCIKSCFINNDDCPICRTKIVTPRLRSQCCEYTYETPKKEFSIYRFILYLFGACVTETVNGDLIMDVLTKDTSALYTSPSYIFYFSDSTSLTKEEMLKVTTKIENIYNVIDIFRIVICLYFSIYNSSLFLSLLSQLFLVSYLINSEIFIAKIKYSSLFFYNNVSNPIYYILYPCFTFLSNILLMTSLFLGVNHISVKIFSLIKILELSFLFINTFSYVRRCVNFISKKLKFIIKSEYQGTTNFYNNIRTVGISRSVETIISLIQTPEFNTVYRQFNSVNFTPTRQNNIPQQYDNFATEIIRVVPRTQTEPIVETQTEPIVETQTEPLVETQTEPLIETQTEPLVETQTEPVVETQTINSTVQIDGETIILSLDLSDLNETESDYENVNEQHSDTN